MKRITPAMRGSRALINDPVQTVYNSQARLLDDGSFRRPFIAEDMMPDDVLPSHNRIQL